ncbi:unnamed protein product [Cercopithifilaria johnstoni]|uniref:Uncharacterized protein n=1 Tax=Cercopithifilaria johnstoni TaxID=2874296 RepID=A0A8J2LTY7_9BILA|nr:unnamed protein product [Cercopithifilaria johnstoni]
MAPRLVRYRSVIPAVDQERIKGNYSWGTFLGGLLRTLSRSGDVRSRCPEYIVPVESFHEAPLIEYMKDIDTNVEFEVALLDDYGFKSGPIKLYWFARVVKIMGYRLLLRFEGMDEKGDNTYDFWVNISSQDLKPIGYCAEDIETRGLVPPQLIYERQPNWQQYILNQIPCYKTFSINWPEILVQKITSCKYKRGDEVELLDSIYRMRVRPAYVEQVIGGRIWVCLNSKFAIRPMIVKGDFQLCEGVWMDQNSPIIFPIGWAWRNGYRMEANGDYFNHVQEVTSDLQLGLADNPSEEHEANPSIQKTEAEGNEITWKIGMKLEVLDPFGSWNELRVSTVTRIMDNGFLKINFDGEMDHHAVPLHFTSELLFPVGYGAKYGISVKKPKNLHDPGNFDWNVYLRMTNGVPAPEELFHTFKDDVLSNFKIGARLEATDMCESNLICPATISSHHGRLLKIAYEGWGSNYNQLFDYRSPNIFPVGWCEMHGYKLTSPAMAKKKRRN